MKKTVFLLFTVISAVLAGCSDNKIPSVYQVGVYCVSEGSLDRGKYKADDNELYKLVKGGINELSAKYGGQGIEDESKALSDYDDAVTLLNNLKQKFDSMMSSGKDFGASEFSTGFNCIVYKDGKEMKCSEVVKFEYESNSRIISPEEIEINTQLSEMTSGSSPVVVADTKQDVKILGWKLYKENGELSASDIITDVELVGDAVGETIFRVCFSARKGVDAGRFYILVTFEDLEKDVFDLEIGMTHTTRGA